MRSEDDADEREENTLALDGVGVPISREDLETDLRGVIEGLRQEYQDPGTHDSSLLNSQVGKVANSYLNLWQRVIESDTQVLGSQTTLAEILLFVATVQAETDLELSGNNVN